MGKFYEPLRLEEFEEKFKKDKISWPQKIKNFANGEWHFLLLLVIILFLLLMNIRSRSEYETLNLKHQKLLSDKDSAYKKLSSEYETLNSAYNDFFSKYNSIKKENKTILSSKNPNKKSLLAKIKTTLVRVVKDFLEQLREKK